MVALQQNLIATASAHQLMAQLIEAGVGVGTEEQERQQGDESELGDTKFRSTQFRVSSF